jgi:hypothetical protein
MAISPARHVMEYTSHQARPKIDAGGASLLISPTHKRAEGRAPVWGSEFASKRRRITGGGPAETAVG